MLCVKMGTMVSPIIDYIVAEGCWLMFCMMRIMKVTCMSIYMCICDCNDIACNDDGWKRGPWPLQPENVHSTKVASSQLFTY